jgi:hypothetical protein
MASGVYLNPQEEDPTLAEFIEKELLYLWWSSGHGNSILSCFEGLKKKGTYINEHIQFTYMIGNLKTCAEFSSQANGSYSRRERS